MPSDKLYITIKVKMDWEKWNAWRDRLREMSEGQALAEAQRLLDEQFEPYNNKDVGKQAQEWLDWQTFVDSAGLRDASKPTKA